MATEQHNIRLVGPKEYAIKDSKFKAGKADGKFVNCTSQSPVAWQRELSPFFLGPVPLYDEYIAQNVENAWQYAKVYEEHVTEETKEPTPEYFIWAKSGWENPNAVRFPKGRGAKPEYSLWEGQRLGYVAARKRIYCPLYASCVVETDGYKQLKHFYEENGELTIWDFDGYDFAAKGMTLRDCLESTKLKMGHCFVLTMLLTDQLLWEHDA